MKTYNVTITETLQRIILVEAETNNMHLIWYKMTTITRILYLTIVISKK